MSKFKLHFILFFSFLLHSSIAQINPPTLPDIFVSNVTAPNTGIAISPNPDASFDYSVVVTDNGNGSGMHEVFLHENQPVGTACWNSGPLPGDDPDVAYWANPDLFYVVAKDGADVLLYEYYLTGPCTYMVSPTIGVSVGMNPSNPNIDINSQGEGVYVFEESGTIYAVAIPYPFSTSAPIAVPLAGGFFPDVAVHDQLGAFTITFINSTGQLEIISYDFIDLLAGTGSFLHNWGGPFSPPVGNFEVPRISTAHHQVIGNFEDFTVVVECAPGRIYAYVNSMIMGQFLPQQIINKAPNTITCGANNSFPVVTYSLGNSPTGSKIVIAWSSDYTPCGLAGGINRDVLIEELDLTLNPIHSGSYERVNTIGGAFNMSKSSITSEYDGYYEASELSESITYHNSANNFLYWKYRDNLNNTYKSDITLEPIASTLDDFTFMNNSHTKQVEIKSSKGYPKSVQIINSMGQEIYQIKLSNEEDQFYYDYSELPQGLYYVTYRSNQTLKTNVIAHF